MISALTTFFVPAPTNCFEQLVWVLNGLVHVVGHRRQHDWTVLRIAAALTARIHRVRRRLMALIEAIRSGGAPLPQRVRRAGRREDPKARERYSRWREIWYGIRFRHGWLCPLLPMDAATLGGYLNLALQDDELRRLMALDPRIAKLLRPFVKMLAGDARLLEVKPEAEAVVAVGGGYGPVAEAVVGEGADVVPVKDFFDGA